VTDPSILDNAWRLGEKLGEGGLAVVYAATHVRTGTRVAVKLLHAQHGADDDLRTRFAREAQIANRIQHPGVVKVLADGIHAGRAYLVMELVEGGSLKARWVERGRRLPLDEVVPVVTQLLEILVAAHASGVVHRDIKLDNVLVEPSGRVRLVDFGVARDARSGPSASPTRTGAMLGTPAFMAPEQALARWAEVDGRTDLFAVAATAWTALSGRLVHDAATVPELLVAAATRPVGPIRRVLPDLPQPIADVLDWALAFERARRPADATIMLDAWRRAVSTASSRAPLHTIVLQPTTPAPALLLATPPSIPAAPRATVALAPTPVSRTRSDEPLRAAPTPTPAPAPAAPTQGIGVSRAKLAVVAAAAAVFLVGATALVVWTLTKPSVESTRKTASARRTDASTPAAPAPTSSTFQNPACRDFASFVAFARKRLGEAALMVNVTWTPYAGTVQLYTGDGRLKHLRFYILRVSEADFDPSTGFDLELPYEGFRFADLDRVGVPARVESALRLGATEGNGAATITTVSVDANRRVFVNVVVGDRTLPYQFDGKGERIP